MASTSPPTCPKAKHSAAVLRRRARTWRSSHTGATYPAAWTVKVPSIGLTLDIKPYLADQELDVSVRYWEGAVHFSGEHNGRAVSGNGYIELTGYTGSMGGQF